MDSGIWASVWSFIKFLPFFFALLLLGIIKGGQNACSVSPFFSPFFLIEVWNVIVLKDGFTRLCPCFVNSINQFTWCVAFASPMLKMVVDRAIRVLPVLMLGCSFQPLLWASVMNNDVTWFP